MSDRPEQKEFYAAMELCGKKIVRVIFETDEEIYLQISDGRSLTISASPTNTSEAVLNVRWLDR